MNEQQQQGIVGAPRSQRSPVAVQALSLAGNGAIAQLLAPKHDLTTVQRECGGGCACDSCSSGPSGAETTEAAPETPGADAAGGTCLTCTALRAAKSSPGGAIAYTGSTPPKLAGTPIALEPGNEEEEAQKARELSDKGTPGAPIPPPVMVPVDASRAGASVVCTGSGSDYRVWMNPSSPACVVPCMTRHEEKHIADFKADSAYTPAVKCASIPDGETFTYASNADAKRFECAASDVEISCITNQLTTEKDDACKTMLTTRKNVTLPNYKAGFSC